MRSTPLARILALLLSVACVGLHHRDNIYEDFLPELQEPPSPLIQCLMNTPLFLRLERVSQLSTLKFNFSSGNITRAAHCRGTRSMAVIYINALNSELDCHEKITEVQSLAVQAAALFHDIGHGPFSHTFETVIRKTNPAWNHEQQSLKIVRHVFETISKEQTKDLPGNFVDAVCDMITGIDPDKHKKKYGFDSNFNRYFLFTIVNNDFEIAFDVDKFDYSMRDSLNTCRLSHFKTVSKCVSDIIQGSRVLNDRIVYSDDCLDTLIAYSQIITMNYRYLYFSPESKGFDILLCDIFEDLFEDGSLIRYVEDLDKFMNFDDDFVETMIRERATENNLEGRFIKRDSYEFIQFWDVEFGSADDLVGKINAQIQNNLVNTAVEPGDYIVKAFRMTRSSNYLLERLSERKIIKRYTTNPSTNDSNKDHLTNSARNGSVLTSWSESGILNDVLRRYYSEPVSLNLGISQIRLYAKTTDLQKINLLKTAASSINV